MKRKRCTPGLCCSAQVALLRELGASPRLSLLIEGESLFNDGTAMVLFIVFADAMKGQARDGGETVAFFAQLSLGGVALGVAAGWITVRVLNALHFDIVAQIATTVFAAYGTFVLAEVTPVHVSGVLATVALGLAMAAGGRTAVHEHETLHEFWEMVEYLANTVVFVLSGAVIMERGFNSEFNSGSDWLWLLLLYLVLNVVRFLTLVIMWPVLRNLGYGITFNEIIVMSWSGLRGAVGLVLALFLDEEEQDSETAARFLFYMAGIAALTLLVNASTTSTLLKYLGLVSRTEASELMFATALHHIEHHTLAKHRQLRGDPSYSSVDWAAVESFMGTVFDDLYAQLQALQARNRFAQAARSGGVRHFLRSHCAWCACCPDRCAVCTACVPLKEEEEIVLGTSPALRARLAPAGALGHAPLSLDGPQPTSAAKAGSQAGASARPVRVAQLASSDLPGPPLKGPVSTPPLLGVLSSSPEPKHAAVVLEDSKGTGPAPVPHPKVKLPHELSTIEESGSSSDMRGHSGRFGLGVTRRHAGGTPLSPTSPLVVVTEDSESPEAGDAGMCGAARVARGDSAKRRARRRKGRGKRRTKKNPADASEGVLDPPPASSGVVTPGAAAPAGPADGYASDNEGDDAASVGSALTATSEESLYTNSSRSDLSGSSGGGATVSDSDAASDESVAGSVSSMKGRLEEAEDVAEHHAAVGAAPPRVLGIAARGPSASPPDLSASVGEQAPIPVKRTISASSASSGGRHLKSGSRPPLRPTRAHSTSLDGRSTSETPSLRRRTHSVSGFGRDGASTPPFQKDGSDGGEAFLTRYGKHQDFKPAALRARAASTTQGAQALDDDLLSEGRYRFYNLLKAEYWELFESGMVGRAAVTQLQEAASSCQDRPAQSLQDFEVVQHLIHANPLREALKALCTFLPDFSQWWLLESMSFEFDLVFGFIEGHRAVHHIFHKVIRSRTVAKAIVKESLAQVSLGQGYLADVEATLPELAGAVKTKHVMRALIHDIANVAKRLQAHGEIEAREHKAISERVYSAWKRVKIATKAPSEVDLLRNVGYLADLDDDTFNALYTHSHRKVYQDGDTIMNQSEKSSGFYIIVRGSVSIMRRISPTSSGAATPDLAGSGSAVSSAATAAAYKWARATGREKTRYESHAAAKGRYELGPMGTGQAAEVMEGLSKSRSRNLTRGLTVTGSTAAAMVRSATEGTDSITASRADSHSSAGSRTGNLLTRLVTSTLHSNKQAGRLIDTVGSGAVVGLLSMLTGQRTLVSSVCNGPVVAVYFSASDIFRLLKSKPNRDVSIPRRIAAPLEEVLCRMAAVIVAEALLAAELKISLKPAQIRQIIQDTEFVRPEPKRPIRIPYRAILLTGAELVPKNRRAALLADRLFVERQRMRMPPVSSRRLRPTPQRVTTVGEPIGISRSGSGRLAAEEAGGAIMAPKSMSDISLPSRTHIRSASALEVAQCVGVASFDTPPQDAPGGGSGAAAGCESPTLAYADDSFYEEEGDVEMGAMGGGHAAEAESIQAPRQSSNSFMDSVAGWVGNFTRTIGLGGDAEAGADEYDPDYHARTTKGGLQELEDSEFYVHRRAFAYLDLPKKRAGGDEWRWFSKGTRLLLIPDRHARLFTQQHAALMAEVHTKRQLRHVGQRAASRLSSTAVGPAGAGAADSGVLISSPAAAAAAAAQASASKRAAGSKLGGSAMNPAMKPLVLGEGRLPVADAASMRATLGSGAARPPPATGIRGVSTPARPTSTASAQKFWHGHGDSALSPSASHSSTLGGGGGSAEAPPSSGYVELATSPNDDVMHTVPPGSHDATLWCAVASLPGYRRVPSCAWRRRTALELGSKRWWQTGRPADAAGDDVEQARLAVYASQSAGMSAAPVFMTTAQAKYLRVDRPSMWPHAPRSPLAASPTTASQLATVRASPLPPVLPGASAGHPHPSADVSTALDAHSLAQGYEYLLGVLPRSRTLFQRSKAVSVARADGMSDPRTRQALRTAWANAPVLSLLHLREHNSDWRVPVGQAAAAAAAGGSAAPTRRRKARSLSAARAPRRHLAADLPGYASDTACAASRLEAGAARRQRKASHGSTIRRPLAEAHLALRRQPLIKPAATQGGGDTRVRGPTASKLAMSTMLRASRFPSTDSLASLTGTRGETYDSAVHAGPTFQQVDAAHLESQDTSDSHGSGEMPPSRGGVVSMPNLAARPLQAIPTSHTASMLSMDSTGSAEHDDASRMIVGIQHVPGGMSDTAQGAR